MIGKVKFFNEKKGYGFIINEDGNDIFVHISDVNNREALESNTNVVFDIGESPKGPIAINVKKVEIAADYPLHDTTITFKEK